jgi:hypothetical protein
LQRPYHTALAPSKASDVRPTPAASQLPVVRPAPAAVVSRSIGSQSQPKLKAVYEAQKQPKRNAKSPGPNRFDEALRRAEIAAQSLAKPPNDEATSLGPTEGPSAAQDSGKKEKQKEKQRKKMKNTGAGQRGKKEVERDIEMMMEYVDTY